MGGCKSIQHCPCFTKTAQSEVEPTIRMGVASPLNRDRIRQEGTTFCRHPTQKASVFVQGQVVICLCYLTLLPAWVLQTGFILLLPRAPESHDYALRAGGSDCAVRLTGSADHALARHARLSTNELALSTVPDLARGARLLDDWRRAGRGNCFRTGSWTAGAVFGSRLPRRARLARSVFAELGADLGCGRLDRDRLRRNHPARSVFTGFAVEIRISHVRWLVLGCPGVFGRRIDLALDAARLAI